MTRFHIGAIKNYDSINNHNGLIQFKKFPGGKDTFCKFTYDSIIDDYVPTRGDLVFFSQTKYIIEVFGIKGALTRHIAFPWDEILNYVGENEFIIIENIDNKTGDVSHRQSIKVLGDWLKELSIDDIKQLFREIGDEIDESGEEHVVQLMDPAIKSLFLSECLSPHYYSTLNESDLEVFSSTLHLIYKESLDNYDYKSVSQIIGSCNGLDRGFLQLIKSCNLLVCNDPSALLSRIRDLDCFRDIIGHIKGRFNFRLEVYLARAIVENDYSFVPELPPLEETQLRVWLLALCEDDFNSLSRCFIRAHEAFRRVYYELISDNIGLMVPLYSYFTEEQKRGFISLLSEEKHGASEYFHSYDGQTIVSTLSSDPFFTSTPTLRVPSDKVIDGCAKQYLELMTAGIIDGISDSVIKACINNVSGINAQLRVLSILNIDQSKVDGFVAKKILNSELAKAFRRQRVEDAIRNLKYAVFDLEAVFDSKNEHYVIKQAAFVSETEKVSFPSDVDSFDIFFQKLASYRIIVGHNIRNWDIGKVLSDNGFSFDHNQFIWDTLEIEMVIDPFSKGFSLNNPSSERHTALSDSEFTQCLFWRQMTCLSQRQFGWFKSLLPEGARIIIDLINPDIIRRLFEKRIGPYTFFKQSGMIAGTLSLDLSIDKYRAPIVVAPKSLWKLIREESDVLFYEENTDASYKRLDREKLSSLPINDIKTAILHSISYSKRKDILCCDLSPSVRHFLSGSLTDYYLVGYSGILPLCCTSWQFDSIEQNRKEVADAIFIVGKEIEARENNNEINGSEELDFSTLLSCGNNRLIRKLSESNAPERISRDLFQRITGHDLPADTGNIWVEVLPDNRFKIKFNRDFGKYAKRLDEAYPGKVCIVSVPQHLAKNPIQIIRSDRTEKGVKDDVSFDKPEVVQRLSSTTKMRSSYWAYQLSLIASLESAMPIVWAVEESREIEGLKSAARSMGFYVPSSEQIQRNIELASDSNDPALIIIGGRDFKKLIDSEIQDSFLLVYNCIDIESKSIKWKGLLPFGDEPMNLSATPTPEDYIYASWPLLEVINYLIQKNNPNCTLYLLDPIFDCCDLNYSKLNACSVPVKPDNYYIECKRHIEHFFSDPVLQPFVVKDVAGAMNEMLEMFKEINPNVSDWKEPQRNILPGIIEKEHNCLICMPTGGGKSILFQLPALYRSKRSGKMSIVISPLKALLKDQVIDLDMPGVEYLNSDRSADEIESIYQKIRGGEIHLLYMTPERFRSRSFMNAFGYRLMKDGGLEYIVFDEAHCISQWGLDFRPDYRYAANVCKQICDKFKDVKVELFTATVTKNVRDDISAIIPVPEENDSNHKRYNPVRDHINLQFVRVEDDPNAKGTREDTLSPRERMRVKLIYNEIKQSDFDPLKSTMLIFSSTRRQVEVFKTELANMFANSGDDRLLNLADQIECFHGGMTTDERDEIYRKFKKTEENDNREYSILVATKAFGMGMNIPDVHYIYHAFPSDNIEDYLQEVGRAGRDEKLIPKGYGSRRSPNNVPLPTKCFISDEDARHSRELQARNSLKWSDVRDIYDVVSKYISGFSKDGLTYVSVPATVWKRETESGLKDDPTAFKIGLYWLSEAKRVETRYLSTAAYDFVIGDCFDHASVGELRPIHDYIKTQLAGAITVGTKLQVKIPELREFCNIRQAELDNLILLCHKQAVIALTNEISFSFSNRYKKNSLEKSILADERPEEYMLPFEACKSMLKVLNNGNYLGEKERKNSISEVLKGTQFYKNTEHIKSETRRLTALKNEEARIEIIAYKLFKLLPSVKSIKEDNDSKKWYFDSKSNNNLIGELDVLANDGFKFLRYLTGLSYETENRENGCQDIKQKNFMPTFVWTNAAAELDFDSSLTICNAADVIRDLGLANIDSFLPTGTEIKLRGNREPLITETLDKDAIVRHPDAEVYIRFNQIDSIRRLKLINLMTLSKINGENPDSLWSHYDESIKDYFECANMDDFLKWNTRVIDNHWLSRADKQMVVEMISQYHGEALKEQLKKLNPEQMVICNEDKDKNIVVLAGPGSGKTRALAIRCAKLLYSDRISREDLLVLAYNRGIVNELRTRLRNLFLSLGYTRMMSRIKVMTFHSFIKTMDVKLRERRARSSHLDVSEVPGFISDYTQNWENDFCEFLRDKDNAKEFSSMLDATSFRAVYFMIDEFQDVTKERLEVLFAMRTILSTIPGRKEPRFFVIGDVNQSIYGYQRTVRDNDGNNVWFDNDGSEVSISPYPYYERLRQELGISKEDDYTMGINYRSYQKILCKAKEVLHTCSRYEDIPIISNPQKLQRDDCVFEYDAASASWDSDFAEIINDLRERGLKQAAFLFRTNSELYAAYSKLRILLNANTNLAERIRVRIQGNSEEFFRTRECYLALYYLKEKDPDDIISETDFGKFLDYIAAEKHLKGEDGQEYLDKEAIDLTYAIALSCFDSMQQNPTYGELADDMMDVAYERASDLLKIKENYKERIPGYEERSEDDIDIVFSVMHRVKGLEFDAVIVNPSDIAMGYEKRIDKSVKPWAITNEVMPKHAIMETLDEERRLLYVSYTRAKEYLRIYLGPRERHLLVKNQIGAYCPTKEESNKYVRIDSGLDNYNKAFDFREDNNFCPSDIRKNEPVSVIKDCFGNGVIKVDNRCIGLIYKNKIPVPADNWNRINGFYINDFYVWRFEDVCKNDKKNGWNNAKKWPPEKRRMHDFVLIPDVAGIGIIE